MRARSQRFTSIKWFILLKNSLNLLDEILRSWLSVYFCMWMVHLTSNKTLIIISRFKLTKNTGKHTKYYYTATTQRSVIMITTSNFLLALLYFGSSVQPVLLLLLNLIANYVYGAHGHIYIMYIWQRELRWWSWNKIVALFFMVIK